MQVLETKFCVQQLQVNNCLILKYSEHVIPFSHNKMYQQFTEMQNKQMNNLLSPRHSSTSWKRRWEQGSSVEQRQSIALEETLRGENFSQRSLINLWALENTSSSPQNASKYFQLHAGNKTKNQSLFNHW